MWLIYTDASLIHIQAITVNCCWKWDMMTSDGNSNVKPLGVYQYNACMIDLLIYKLTVEFKNASLTVLHMMG